MGDAPPPRLAPRGRPTLITDLPTDVLSYIISLGPYYIISERVRLSVVCRAFADAVRPPSAVWENVRITFFEEEEKWSDDTYYYETEDDDVYRRGLREHRNPPSEQGAYGTLERAMQVAGPAVRRFSYGFYNENEDVPAARAWVERVLATAPRVHRVDVAHSLIVEGPPPLVSAGRAAILDCWTTFQTFGPSRDNMDAVLHLLRRLAAVGRQAGSVAARTVPVVTSMHLNLAGVLKDRDNADMDAQRLFSFIRSLAADVGQHLTRLRLTAGRGWSKFGVLACVDHLPALRELCVDWWGRHDPLDLRSVVTPSRGLTCLVVDSDTYEPPLLSPAIMDRLEVMGVEGYADDPPACLRDAGNSFRRLTRLVYGGRMRRSWADLAGWAMPAFAVPTLVVLEVVSPSFTLRAADGPAWAATVASTTLPRLERLELFHGQHRRSVFKKNRRMRANAVAEAITHSLPAAAAAAGRSLSVRVQGWNDEGLHYFSKHVNPHFDEYYYNVFLALKYEARPVR